MTLNFKLYNKFHLTEQTPKYLKSYLSIGNIRNNWFCHKHIFIKLKYNLNILFITNTISMKAYYDVVSIFSRFFKEP